MVWFGRMGCSANAQPISQHFWVSTYMIRFQHLQITPPPQLLAGGKKNNKCTNHNLTLEHITNLVMFLDLFMQQ